MKNIVEVIERDAVPADVVAVISNRPGASAIDWALQHDLETRIVPHREYNSRESFDAALAAQIDEFSPHYVLLAGFMRVLTPAFVRRFAGRLINIHPSLLPAFPGLHTHEQALAQGVQWHGCTVHFVTDKLDHGPIIAQGAVPVLADDTPDSLAARVLTIEHTVYGRVVNWLAHGQVTLTPNGTVDVRRVNCRAFSGQAHDVDV